MFLECAAQRPLLHGLTLTVPEVTIARLVREHRMEMHALQGIIVLKDHLVVPLVQQEPTNRTRTNLHLQLVFLASRATTVQPLR